MIRWKSCMVGMAFLLALAIAPPLRAQTEFRWKFQEGDAWDVRMTQEVANEMNGKKTDVVQELTLRWTIKSVLENGNASIEQSVRALKSSSGGKLLLDAEDAEPQESDLPAAARLRTLMRVRFTAETTPRGEIVDVLFDPEVVDRLRDQLGLDEDTVRQSFAQESLSFPSQAIDVGFTWVVTSKTPVQGVGFVNTSTTYQYVGSETIDGKSLDKFKVTPSFQLDDDARAMVQQEGSGTIWFDRELGRIHRSETKQSFEWKRELNGKPISQKNEVTTRVQFGEPKK